MSSTKKEEKESIPNPSAFNSSDSSDQFDPDEFIDGIDFIDYQDESQLSHVMKLVGDDLSEPYSIFTYRYFLHPYPNLCIFAVPTNSMTNVITATSSSTKYEELEKIPPIGCVVCKIDTVPAGSLEEQVDLNSLSHDNALKTEKSISGYMGMLAVNHTYRRLGIGKALLKRAIRRMREMGCSSVTLETEVSNKAAMTLYEKLGFMKEELLVRYYLNQGDAYRMKLWFA